MLLGMVPALVVSLVLLALLVLIAVESVHLTRLLTPFADGWGHEVRTVVRVGLAVVLVGGAAFVSTLVFTGVVLTVGDPFYERIWRETERMLGGEVPEHGVGFWRSARDGLALAGVGLLAGIGVVVVGFLPVAGAVAGLVAGTLISGWLLGVELVGRPLEARGLDRAARRELLAGHRLRLLGFGVTTQLCFLVPLGAVIVMPAAVVGSTMLARDVLEARPVPR